MRRTIQDLVPRYERLGFSLTLIPNHPKGAWIMRDTITGEVEDFGDYGHDVATVRSGLRGRSWQAALRKHRVRVLFEQGKTIDETAEILEIQRRCVQRRRKTLWLPTRDPVTSPREEMK